MRRMWLLVLVVGCTHRLPKDAPSWMTHPECHQDYDDHDPPRTVAIYCPSPTGYR